jgi:hypothetical protein
MQAEDTPACSPPLSQCPASGCRRLSFFGARRWRTLTRSPRHGPVGRSVAGVSIAAGILYPWFGLLLSPTIASAAMTFSSESASV